MGAVPTNGQSTVHYQYSISINGKKVGTIQRFNPSSERDLVRIRQIMDDEQDTVEIAMGRTATQVTVERFETNAAALMDAIGMETFDDISDITYPIDITETMNVPGILGKKRVLQYMGCVPKSWSKSISVDTITVTESITFWITRVKKIR